MARRRYANPSGVAGLYRPPAKKKSKPCPPGHGGNMAARIAWEKQYIHDRIGAKPEVDMRSVGSRDYHRSLKAQERWVAKFSAVSLQAMRASQKALKRGEI